MKRNPHRNVILKPRFILLPLLVIAVLACTQLLPTARAQTPTWSEGNAREMWTAYNSAFYTTDAGGYQIFSITSGSTTTTGYWEEANEIAMAEDGYDWAVRNNNIISSANMATEVENLCKGFWHNFTGTNPWWQWDKYNDDICWATIAMARAYTITGDSLRLTDAESAFQYVWNNGQPTSTGGGTGSLGLTQIQNQMPWRMYANVNFTFVIAGYTLYNITGNSTYKTEADAIWTWAKANLYVYNDLPPQSGPPGNICSMIYNYNNSEFTPGDFKVGDVMYNYGIAIQAAVLEGDTTVAQTVANWMMYNINADPRGSTTPYAGTYNGYNVLPDYGVSPNNNGSNDSGYDGIAFRGFGYALQNHALTNPDALPFAQANAQSAWNHRASNNLEWCGWTTTPSGTEYSWGDSCALATLFNIPAPVRMLQASSVINGSSTSVTVTLPMNPSTAGDLLVVSLSGDAGCTFFGPTGWVNAISIAGSVNKGSIWYYPSCPAGISTATFTITSSTYGRAVVSEWTGLTALDVTGRDTPGGGASSTVSNSANTTATSEVAISQFIEYFPTAQTVTLTPDTNWSNMANNNSSSLHDHATADYHFVDASGVAVSETETSSASGTEWVNVIATFKP